MFLAPDRERYQGNIDLYEEEILSRNNESFYTPEGYRAIKQILLHYPAEAERAVKNELARCNLAARKLAAAFQELATKAIEAEKWEDLADARAAYDEAAAETGAVLKDYAEKRNALTGPLIQPTVEAVRAEYEAGIDIDSIIRKYSQDTSEKNTTGGGYPFHPDSRNWSEEFSAAAAALEKPGDLSEPVYTDLGIHLLYYAADIPAGEHELTDTEKATLTDSATYYYQVLELEKLIEGWKKEYDIETHPELLD